jgi:hypothetical protein
MASKPVRTLPARARQEATTTSSAGIEALIDSLRAAEPQPELAGMLVTDGRDARMPTTLRSVADTEAAWHVEPFHKCDESGGSATVHRATNDGLACHGGGDRHVTTM